MSSRSLLRGRDPAPSPCFWSVLEMHMLESNLTSWKISVSLDSIFWRWSQIGDGPSLYSVELTPAELRRHCWVDASPLSWGVTRWATIIWFLCLGRCSIPLANSFNGFSISVVILLQDVTCGIRRPSESVHSWQEQWQTTWHEPSADSNHRKCASRGCAQNRKSPEVG